MRVRSLALCAVLLSVAPSAARDEPAGKSVGARLRLQGGESFAYQIRERMRFEVPSDSVLDRGKKTKRTFVTRWDVALRVLKVGRDGSAELEMKLLALRLTGVKIPKDENPAGGTVKFKIAADGSLKRVGAKLASWMGGKSGRQRARNGRAFLSMMFPPRPAKDAAPGAKWRTEREMRTRVIAIQATISILDETFAVESVAGGVATVKVTGKVKKEIDLGRSSQKQDRDLSNLAVEGTLELDADTGLVKSWTQSVDPIVGGYVFCETKVTPIPVPADAWAK